MTATIINPSADIIQVEGASGSTNMYQLITVRSALKFEIQHPGMKMSRISALSVAQRVTGCSRSKKAAWTAVNDIISQVRPDMEMPQPW